MGLHAIAAVALLLIGAAACRSDARISTDMAFHMERQQIMNRIRDPEGPESNLWYWRNRYATLEKRFTRGVNGIVELRIPHAGRTLLYQEASDRVVKIVEYAPIPD
jgi:hypothetical protein